MRSPPYLLPHLPLLTKCLSDHLKIQSLSTAFFKGSAIYSPQEGHKFFLGFHCCTELTGKYKRQQLPADEGSTKSLIS